MMAVKRNPKSEPNAGGQVPAGENVPVEQEGQCSNPLAPSLELYWLNFVRQLTACQENASVESVHDLRVATRRLLTLLELLLVQNKLKPVERIHEELKKLRTDFDKLRDTQVMIAELGNMAPQVQGSEEFLAYLRKRELSQKSAVGLDIAKYKVHRNAARVTSAQKVLCEGCADPEDCERKVLRAVDGSFRVVQRLWRKLDSSKPATFHALRIACRRFRYQLEVINSIFIQYPSAKMAAIRALQDKLGDIQNHEVMLGILDRYTRKHGDCNLTGLRDSLVQKTADAMTAILMMDAKPEMLWRASKREAFPWAGGAAQANENKPIKSAGSKATKSKTKPEPAASDEGAG